MEFLFVDADLAHRPETLVMADTLGISRHAVAGALVELWGWAQCQTADGRVVGDPASIESAVGCPPGFLMAMVHVGWLEVHEGYVVFPTWQNWLAKSAKYRIQRSLDQKVRRNVRRQM